MMLSLATVQHARVNRFLGAKGWVDALEDQVLATGQIVSRKGQSIDKETLHGGMSTLVAEAQHDAPFVFFRKDDQGRHTIEAAACLHFRAIYKHEASMSRGYLVRCRGLEGYGGKPHQLARDRYVENRNLQERLAAKWDSDLELGEAARHLQGVTGMAEKAFAHMNPETGMPRGLLVNLPFAQGDAKLPLNMPLALPRDIAPNWAKDYESRDVSGNTEFGVKVTLEG